jgi:hypothetical protein
MEFDGIPRGAIVRGTGAFQTPQAPQRLILPRQKSLKGGGDFRPQFFASAGAGSADVIGATQPGVLASAACGAAKPFRTTGERTRGFFDSPSPLCYVRHLLHAVRGPRVPGFHDPDKELRREFMEPSRGAIRGRALLPQQENSPRRRPAPDSVGVSGFKGLFDQPLQKAVGLTNPELFRTDLACTPRAAQDRRPL